MKRIVIFSLWLCLLITQTGLTQDEPTTVPDIIGLSIPQAAATLNRSGLTLGMLNNIAWTAESGLHLNTISEQNIAAGQSVAQGTAIDVTVLRAQNTVLIYDDNDLTLVNQDVVDIDLTGITFTALDGSEPAAFSASRWAASLSPNQCTQIWSIGRNDPKSLDECLFIQNWLTTNNPLEHFWTGAHGATHFSISQHGIERAVCTVSAQGHCEFYLTAGGSTDDVTAFVYLAYTSDQFIILNTAYNQWMPLEQTVLYNTRSGTPIPVGDPLVYLNLDPVADATQLAPGQCILFTDQENAEAENLPIPCHVIAQAIVDPGLFFWVEDFELDSVTDGRRHSCPGATPGGLTLCIMPR